MSHIWSSFDLGFSYGHFLGLFDSGGVCSIGPCFVYLVCSWHILGSLETGYVGAKRKMRKSLQRASKGLVYGRFRYVG